MSCDFKSKSCFSSVLGYPGLVQMMLCWLGFCSVGHVLVFAFFHIAISWVRWTCCLRLWFVSLQAWVSTPGRPVLSLWNLSIENCSTGSAHGRKQKPEWFCPQLILGSCVLRALCSSLFVQEFDEKWWSYLWTQLCRYSWEIDSQLLVFVYVALWPRIISGHRQKSEDSCPRLPLGSCVMSVSGGFLWAARMVPTSAPSHVYTSGRLAISLATWYGALWQRMRWWFFEFPHFLFLCLPFHLDTVSGPFQ